MFDYRQWAGLPIGTRSGPPWLRARRRIVAIVLSVLVLAVGSLNVVGVAPLGAATVAQCDPGDAVADGQNAEHEHSHTLGHHHCPLVLCGAWMACSAETQPVPDRSVGWAIAEPRNPVGIDASGAEPPPRA